MKFVPISLDSFQHSIQEKWWKTLPQICPNSFSCVKIWQTFTRNSKHLNMEEKIVTMILILSFEEDTQLYKRWRVKKMYLSTPSLGGSSPLPETKESTWKRCAIDDQGRSGLEKLGNTSSSTITEVKQR